METQQSSSSIKRHFQITRKPFSARIFRLYLDYLKSECAWSDQRVANFLEFLGIGRSQLEDELVWFDLEFADRFYEKIRAETNDPEVAFRAGLFVKKNLWSRAIFSAAKGLISVGKLYELISKYTSYFTLASELRITKRSGNEAVLESIPLIPGHERPYMCENRRGILCGIPQIFNLPPANLEEIECFHKGASRCLYHVKWREVAIYRYSFISIILFAFSFVASFYLFDDYTIAFSNAFLSVFILGFSFLWRSNVGHREDLISKNEILDLTLKEVEKKNSELELISQISKMTHALVEPGALAKAVVEAVCELLRFDRAIFLSVDNERQVLSVNAFYGFDEATAEILGDAEFNINSENTTGFFIKAVTTRQPVLIDNVESHINELSPRSKRFAKILGAHSFVAVPLKDRSGNVLGVLSVDYVDQFKKMTHSDQELLMTLADHLSIAIHNSFTREQLEKNLKISRENSKRQEIVGRVFRKFLPTDLSNELLQVSDSEKMERLLTSVKKKQIGVLFTDIFNFTRLSQDLEPERVIELLNICFEVFEPIISRHRGFVDKYMGDGLIAIFDSVDAVEELVLASAELVQAVPTVCKNLHEVALPGIDIGVGIHYGPVIIGNVGSHDRLNFTVIGESVNLASRLENATRQTGPNSICASAVVRHQAGHLFEWKEFGSVEMKGYQEPIPIFQLIVPSVTKTNLIHFPKEKSSD